MISLKKIAGKGLRSQSEVDMEPWDLYDDFYFAVDEFTC